MWSQRDPSKRRSGVGNIFISGLHADVDNRTLHDTFARFGDILSCKVVQGPDGKSRGIAFVHFKEPESAENGAFRGCAAKKTEWAGTLVPSPCHDALRPCSRRRPSHPAPPPSSHSH